MCLYLIKWLKRWALLLRLSATLMKKLLLILFLIITTTISSSVNYQFNSIEKIVELYQQKIELYERMLKEKNELINKLMQQQSK